MRKGYCASLCVSWCASLLLGAVVLSGCGLERDRLFERNAPTVNRAIDALDAGDVDAAAALLQAYLSTGSCDNGEIGVSDLVRNRTNATFDLGLVLFQFGEKYGARFGEEERSIGEEGPTEQQQQLMELRSGQVTCALKIVRAIGASTELPVDLAARARYLEGNLEFLRREYREAVRAYDDSLRLIPGVEADAGMDEIGRDAAWNRAIALRRIEENEKDAGQDAQDDSSPDSESGSPDGGDDGQQEAGDDGNGDAPSEGGGDNSEDAGDSSSSQDEEDKPDSAAPEPEPQSEPPPEPPSQDERVLDELEAAPMVQLEEAKKNAARRPVRGMEDK